MKATIKMGEMEYEGEVFVHHGFVSHQMSKMFCIEFREIKDGIHTRCQAMWFRSEFFDSESEALSSAERYGIAIKDKSDGD